MTSSDNLVKMKYIITQAAKRFGNDKIKFGIEPVTRKSTGSVYFDYLLNGGFESGTLMVYYGQAGSGKSTMALRNIAAAQRRGESCAWLRIEKGCNCEYMEKLGVDTNKLLLVENLPFGEDYLDLLITLIEEDIDMIVVDSISSLIPKREMVDPLEKEHPGLQAKLITRMLGKVNAVNKKSNVILISQVREKFNSQGYTMFNFAGGRAAEHYSDYIVEFKLKEKLDDDGKEVSSSDLKTENKNDVTGANMLMYTRKCRRGLAHKAGEMYFNFQTGKIDDIGELIRVAIKLKVFTYEGGWITLSDELTEQFNLKSNKIRHSGLKEIITNDVSIQDMINVKIKEYYNE